MQEGDQQCRENAEKAPVVDADDMTKEEQAWRSLWLYLYEELRAIGITRPQYRAVPENLDCVQDYRNGENRCVFRNFPPVTDCRTPWCPHASHMRTRVLKRLCRRYAPGIKPTDVQPSSPLGTVAETGCADTGDTNHAR